MSIVCVAFACWSLALTTPVLAGTVTTELGDIPTDVGPLVSWVVGKAIGIGGGIALLLLVYGGIRYISSQGDPDSTAEAQEIITAAISGVILIILSVFILKLLGQDILGLDFFIQ